MAGRRNGKVGSSGRWSRAKRGSSTLWQFAGERGLFYFIEKAPGQRVVLYQDLTEVRGRSDEKVGTFASPGQARAAVATLEKYGTRSRPRKRNVGGRRRNVGGKTQHYIIVYDVKDKDPNVASSRRKALHHRLTKWMQPVQRSVMEAALTKAELGKVIDVASSVLNLNKDTFKVFLQQNKRPVVVLGTAQDLSLLAIKKSKLTSPMSYKFKQGSKYASNPRRRNGLSKGQTVDIEGGVLAGARGVLIDRVKTTRGSTGWVVRLKTKPFRGLYGGPGDEVVVRDKFLVPRGTYRQYSVGRYNP